MSKRNPRLYLQDILESISRIEEYTKGMKFADFRKNLMAQDAVIRNIEIIGEAASKLPKSLTNKHPDVPWSKMKGMRNLAIHEYFGVDINITWKTVSKSLLKLKPMIETALGSVDQK